MEELRSPWRLIWTQPSAAMAAISARPRRSVLVLAAALVLLNMLSLGADNLRAIFAEPPSRSALIVALSVVGGSLLGIVSLYFSGWLLTMTSRLFHGAGSAELTRAALAWSGAVTIPALVVAGIVQFTGNPQQIDVVSLLVGVFGVWAMVALIKMLGYAQRISGWRATGAVFLFYALLLALSASIRAFVAQPFNIPSATMAPTLMRGDYLFVSKPAYGYSRHSFPFSPPLFEGRMLAQEPARGDVVVFRHPAQPGVDYIKRLVGLPGDQIQMIAGRLFINGKTVARKQVAPVTLQNREGRAVEVATYEETLPGGARYRIAEIEGDDGFIDNTEVFEVPTGHYFVMGDNRDNSTDSRIGPERGGVGFVPFENLIGRANWIYFSKAMDEADRPIRLRLDRVGQRVR